MRIGTISHFVQAGDAAATDPHGDGEHGRAGESGDRREREVDRVAAGREAHDPDDEPRDAEHDHEQAEQRVSRHAARRSRKRSWYGFPAAPSGTNATSSNPCGSRRSRTHDGGWNVVHRFVPGHLAPAHDELAGPKRRRSSSSSRSR